jgi:hypothetical protein
LKNGRSLSAWSRAVRASRASRMRLQAPPGEPALHSAGPLVGPNRTRLRRSSRAGAPRRDGRDGHATRFRATVPACSAACLLARSPKRFGGAAIGGASHQCSTSVSTRSAEAGPSYRSCAQKSARARARGPGHRARVIYTLVVLHGRLVLKDNPGPARARPTRASTCPRWERLLSRLDASATSKGRRQNSLTMGWANCSRVHR